VEPKSKAGRRDIPIPAVLRAPLAAHKVASGNRDGLVFRSALGSHFDPSTVAARAKKSWEAAKLPPLGLHEARHTYASLMIAAGVNANTLKVYMGHSSIIVTLDRYGHLFPGNESQAAALLDASLEQTATGVVPGG
jgi:integrase